MSDTDLPRNDNTNDIQSSKGTTNPDALIEMLNKILSSQNTAKDSGPQSSQPNTDIFSSLLSNPEILSKLPQLMSVISPLIGSLSAQSKQSDYTQAQTQSIISPPVTHTQSKPQADNRAALLCAMKPYMGKERQDAIDYIIKLSKLGDILKSL